MQVFLLISMSSAFLTSNFGSWEPGPPVIDKPSLGSVCIHGGWQCNPPPTVKHNPTCSGRSKSNTLPHISSTLDPHLEIWRQFLWHSLHYIFYRPSFYYLLFPAPIRFVSLSTHKYRVLNSLHLLAEPLIISAWFINPEWVWFTCWHCGVPSVLNTSDWRSSGIWRSRTSTVQSCCGLMQDVSIFRTFLVKVMSNLNAS